MLSDVEPGKYVVAVSGGVDSMVLLDLLSKRNGLELIVAHFEHGIRNDSDDDRKFVEEAAQKYGYKFEYTHGQLGAAASEAIARDARYVFLKKIMDDTQAKGIITAHHQDDLIETAILNLLRGTGRKGLSSLKSRKELLRPLLHTPKETLISYAIDHGIKWHEDSTNASDEYLRNYIRHNIVPRLGGDGRQRLIEIIYAAEDINPKIDELLFADIKRQSNDGSLQRSWFIMLPYDVSCEVMAAWLREKGIREFDRATIDRLVIAAKVYAIGRKADINAEYLLELTKTTLQIVRRSTS